MEVLWTITLAMIPARKIFNYVNKGYSFSLVPLFSNCFTIFFTKVIGLLLPCLENHYYQLL